PRYPTTAFVPVPASAIAAWYPQSYRTDNFLAAHNTVQFPPSGFEPESANALNASDKASANAAARPDVINARGLQFYPGHLATVPADNTNRLLTAMHEPEAGFCG